jgi:TRAP transporter TAXI family solute receptor
MRLLNWLAVCLVIALALPTAPARSQERFMVMGGGSTGGLFFIVAAGMGRVIEKHVPNTRVTAQVTSGSVENIRLLGQRRIDCALSSADGAYHAANQSGPFEKEKYTNVRYITRGYSSILQNIVMADSPIRSLADIKGKRVAILIGITAQDWFPSIAAAYGLKQGQDFRVSVLRATELINALRDGNADLSVYFAGAPTSTVTDIATSRPVRFLPLGEKEADEVIKRHPYFFRGPLAKGVYPGLNEDVQTLHVPILLVCREDVPTDVVYAMTKALMDNNEELKQIHPEAASFGLENAGKSMVVPIHPGAERYYREKGIRLGS